MMDRVEVYGADWCADTKKSRSQLEAWSVPYSYVDIERDEAAAERVRDWNGGRQITPTVLLPEGGVVTGARRLAAPSLEELEGGLRDSGALR